MKLIAWGDEHAHLFQEFAEKHPEFGNTRFEKILYSHDYMTNYCLKNNIKYMLFAGDMFHKRVAVDQTVRNLVYDKIKNASDAGLLIYMIPGNHDQVDNTDYPHHALHEFQDIEGVTILDKFLPESLWLTLADEDVDNPTVIFPAPYSKNVQMVKDKITEYTEMIVKEKIQHSILLGHMGISGANVGKSSYSMQDSFNLGDLYPEIFQFGIFGHYHKGQYLGNTKHFAYTGSPLQHNFNDEGCENGFIEIDTDTGVMEFKSIPSPKFITVTDPETNLDSLVGNYVRLQIPADKVESLKEEIPEELKARIEPQKEYNEEKRVDIDQSMSNSEIVVEYCKKYNPSATDVLLEILREVE